MADVTVSERALGAFLGLALGDALGMPTQSMSPQEITGRYGRITGLVDAAADQPVAPGMRAGSVTDDTEQAILVGQLLVEGHGHIDPMRFSRVLLAWEDDMRARGSLDLLGPSTKHALEQVRRGADPRGTGTSGTTNGAPMRVTPVGIAFPLNDRARLTAAVRESCIVTHNTRQGFEGATLVAAGVSHAIDHGEVLAAIDAALDLVGSTPTAGHWSPKPSVLVRTQEALETVGNRRGADLSEWLRTVAGTSVECAESVPCALVIARQYADDPFAGLCLAAGLGGDTDTIGAMAGAILGAAQPDRLPRDVVEAVVTQSHLDLEPLVQQLLELRLGGCADPS